jgi:hypothetical protein
LVLSLGVAGLAAIVIAAVATHDDGEEKEAELPPWTDEDPPAEPTAAKDDDKPVAPLLSAARSLTAALPAAEPGGATDAGKYFPPDEALVLTIRVRDLLDSAAFGPALRNLKDSPDLAPALLFARVCKLDPFADLDWAAIGLPSGESDDLDFVLSGALDRKAIAKCSKEMSDDAEITWIDDRTIFFSTRDVKVAPDASFATRNADLLARTDRGGTLWIAGDPQSAFGAAEGDELPPPRRIAGGARLGDALAIDAWLHYASAAEARKAVDIATRELDGIGAILGDPKLEPHGADVHLTAHVDPLVTALLGAAIEAAAKP